MGQISRFRTNPGALQAVFATGGKGAEALSLGLVLEKSELALEVVSGARPATTEDESRVAAWFATKQLQTGNGVNAEGLPVKVDGTQAVRLVDVIKGAGQDVSVAALNDPRVVRSVATTKETHGQVINMVDSYTSALTTEYNTLLATGGIPEGDLRVEGNVLIDAGAGKRAAIGGRTQQRVTESAAASIGFGAWVEKVNRYFKLGETYKGVGVLPQASWAGSDAQLKTLTTGVKDSGEDVIQKSSIIKWGLDAQGNPIPLSN